MGPLDAFRRNYSAPLPPQIACFLVRTTLPYVGDHLGKMLREQIEAQRAQEAAAAGAQATRPG